MRRRRNRRGTGRAGRASARGAGCSGPQGCRPCRKGAFAREAINAREPLSEKIAVANERQERLGNPSAPALNKIANPFSLYVNCYLCPLSQRPNLPSKSFATRVSSDNRPARLTRPPRAPRNPIARTQPHALARTRAPPTHAKPWRSCARPRHSTHRSSTIRLALGAAASAVRTVDATAAAAHRSGSRPPEVRARLLSG